MSDAPTDVPALTDEQIDELTETVRADFVASAADEDEIRADHETFARWYAAVIARAKREERELIAHLIDGEMDVLTEDGQPLSSDEAAEYAVTCRSPPNEHRPGRHRGATGSGNTGAVGDGTDYGQCGGCA